MKQCGPHELIKAIWAVFNRGEVVFSSVAKTVVDYFRARGSVLRLLTERERQVLKCLSSGLRPDVIAPELGADRERVPKPCA